MRFYLQILLGLFWLSPIGEAKVEVLIAGSAGNLSSLECVDYLSMSYDLPTFYAHVADAPSKVILTTREQVRSIYRAIQIAPEAELLAMDEEERHFPAQAVVYLRSVNDATGVVEGIMRLVSARAEGKYYYNNFFAFRSGGIKPSPLPIATKYPDDASQSYIREHFANAFEMGRVVFAPGVNEFRVLIDLGTVATHLMSSTNPKLQSLLVVEAVPQAQHRYEALGLKVTPSPIPLKEGRILMTAPVMELYDKYLGRIRRAVLAYGESHPSDRKTREAALKEINDAIRHFSESEALGKLYSYGLFARAEMHHSEGNFALMLKDAKELIRRNPDVPDYRVLWLAAEVSIRYDSVNQKGAPQAALSFLNDPKTAIEFSPERLPKSAVYPDLLEYYRGMIYLSQGDYQKAKESRRKIDLIPEIANGSRVSCERLAEQEMLTYERTWLDPDNLQAYSGDFERADYILRNRFYPESPLALTTAFHRYAARVYRAYGKEELARRHEVIAQALKE